MARCLRHGITLSKAKVVQSIYAVIQKQCMQYRKARIIAHTVLKYEVAALLEKLAVRRASM